MNELRQMYTVSYEYAVERLESIVDNGGAPLTDNEMGEYLYWEGQRDAYQRAVEMLNRQIFLQVCGICSVE